MTHAIAIDSATCPDANSKWMTLRWLGSRPADEECNSNGRITKQSPFLTLQSTVSFAERSCFICCAVRRPQTRASPVLPSKLHLFHLRHLNGIVTSPVFSRMATGRSTCQTSALSVHGENPAARPISNRNCEILMPRNLPIGFSGFVKIYGPD